MSLTTKLVLGGVFAVVTAICIIGAVLAVVATDDGGSVEINLGDETFEIDAEDNAAVIADTGPLLLGDVSGGGRPILLQHLGDDPDDAASWSALLAVAPGTESCIVEWVADDDEFRDCEGERYPADGAGLTRYLTTVEDGTVVVDLRTETGGEREPVPPSPTTTP